MMSTRKADEAQKWADRATDDVNRAAWLRVAQGWLEMIKPRPRTAEQKFNDETRDRRTGPSSDESN